MRLRVGIVGVGEHWESRHRPALRALADRFEVRAVCAGVAVRAEQAAREFEADAVDGFRKLAARKDIDAVLILSPQWYGPLPILAACEAGKAVYCGAGLDVGTGEADAIRRQVHDSGVAFMMEFPRRHAPATVRLKELIATRLGTPRLLFCHHRLSITTRNHLPRVGEPSPELLTFLELVDWCRYVVNSEPSSVMGVCHHRGSGTDVHDYQMMNLDFSAAGAAGTGPVAQVSCGHYMPSEWTEAITFRPPAALQVVCQHGVAFVDLPNMLTWFDQAGRHLESLDHERPVGEQLLLVFHRTVTSLVQQTASLEDALRALTIVRTAEQSGESGRRVALDEEAAEK